MTGLKYWQSGHVDEAVGCTRLGRRHKSWLACHLGQGPVVMSVYVCVCVCVYALLINYDNVNNQSLQIIFMCFLE
jgi:hypothetical protein